MCYGTHLAMELEDKQRSIQIRLSTPLNQCPICHGLVSSEFPATIGHYTTPDGKLVDILIYHVECWREAWQERRVGSFSTIHSSIERAAGTVVWCHWAEMGIFEQLRALNYVFAKKVGVASKLRVRALDIEGIQLLDPSHWLTLYAANPKKAGIRESLKKLKQRTEEFGRRKITATANPELVKVLNIITPTVVARGVVGFGDEFIDAAMQIIKHVRRTEAAMTAICELLGEMENRS